MTKGKLIGFGALILVAVAAVAAYLLYSNLDAIVKAAIEKYGTQVTRSEVSVNNVQLALTKGEGTISGLRVANPQGFSANNIFQLGRIAVKVDPASVTGNTVVIPHVLITAPHILYEINKSGMSNLKALQQAIDQSMPKGKSEASADKSEGGKKIIIRKLVIDDAQADIHLGALIDKQMSAKLPRIELNNIGEKSGGASPAEVGRQVISAISRSTTKVVSNMGVDKLINEQLQKQLGNAGEAARKAVGGKAEEAVKGAGDALKGLLGGKE